MRLEETSSVVNTVVPRIHEVTSDIHAEGGRVPENLLRDLIVESADSPDDKPQSVTRPPEVESGTDLSARGASRGVRVQAGGPIDYLALELPAAKVRGEGFAALVDLVDRGIIRVLDMRAVRREYDGTFTAIAITDLEHDGTLDFAIFEGIESGLLDDDDLRQVAELIEPGKVVALLLYENTWAAPFVAAMRRAGAELIASGRIPADEVEAALDVFEGKDPYAQSRSDDRSAVSWLP
jgi:hypothetical protein